MKILGGFVILALLCIASSYFSITKNFNTAELSLTTASFIFFVVVVVLVALYIKCE
jgi:hypothetical protein